MEIRIADKKDAARLLRIYSPFIQDNAVSFETKVPSVVEFEMRMESYMQTYPWLVCEHKGKIIGYAYASRYRDRVAYQWSCECSVYIDRNFQRKGIAGILYSAVFDILRCQGFVNAYAVITYPNASSIKFHEQNGFELFAIYKSVGFKLGRWHDVHWYRKKLNACSSRPKAPKPFSKIKKSATVKEIIEKYQQILIRK